MIPPPFKSQQYTTQFILDHRHVFVMSDAGTGKTRAILDAIATIRRPFLVLSPKSIMRSAWVNDTATFTPHLQVAVCPADCRAAAFASPADIYVTNHDAVKWLVGPKSTVDLTRFAGVIVDESTAYKNPTSQRSRAARALADYKFDYFVCMSGTPFTQTILDLWNQMYLVDQGASLGTKFFAFRSAVCDVVNVSGFNRWVDKPGAADAVLSAIADRTVRFKLEDCLDMPDRIYRTIKTDLGPATQELYDSMYKQAVLEFESSRVSAVNGAALTTKLLQIASGAVYSSVGSAESFIETADVKAADSRYNIVAELCAERKQTLVAFQWQHQKHRLIEALKAAGITNVGVIDGTTSDAAKIVAEFQNQQLRVVLAHPQSAGHGLTLTNAEAVIWASPTYRGELFLQFNSRIYRVGQTKKTEVIMLAANNTIEPKVYARLADLVDGQAAGLDFMSLFTKESMDD